MGERFNKILLNMLGIIVERQKQAGQNYICFSCSLSVRFNVNTEGLNLMKKIHIV